MQEYTVKAGDTLNKIANQFGYGNYKQAGLVAKSGNPDLIRPGEVYSINPSATSPRDAFVSNLSTTQSRGGSPLESQAPTDVASPAKTDYLKTYRDYLSKYAGSLTEDPEVTAARNNLVGLQNKGDEQSLASRKAYEDLIHTSGMTKGGALEAGSVSNRNNSYILANLGIAESGAARKLDALTGAQTAKQNYYKTAAELAKPIEIGDQIIDPTTGEVIYTKPASGFELSPGQTRFDASGKPIASLPATPKTISPTQQKNAAQGMAQQKIAGLIGQAVPGSRDEEGFVTPTYYRDLRAAWIADGLSGADFDSIFGGYVNPTKAKQYGVTFQTKPSANSGEIDPELQALLDSLQ